MPLTNPPPSLTDILANEAIGIFIMDFGRYFIAAALVYAVVSIMRRTRLASRKIQTREATFADMRREFLGSVQTVLVYVVVFVGVYWAVLNGWLHKPTASQGLLANLGWFAAIVIAHDAYFYWVHRAMHSRLLFKHFHRFHHRSVTPTPWAAYAFAVPEAVVMAVFMPIWMSFFAAPGIVIFSFLAFMIIRNAMGHAGFELLPRWWLSTPLTRWINTTTHHDLHHNGSFKHNYGLYFTWWDKMMGTEHPRYHAEFARVTGGKLVEATPKPATASAIA